MGIEKAVLLAGRRSDSGIWTQLGLRALGLVPVANRPLLFHSLDSLEAGGVRSTALVVDERAAPEIRSLLAARRPWGLDVHLVEAPGRLGSLDQLRAAAPILDGESFIAQRGDVLLHDRIRPLTGRFAAEGLDALALELPPVSSGPDVIGMCLLRPEALDWLGAGGAGAELDDLVDGVRANGGRVSRRRIAGCLPCGGDRAALLAANRQALEGILPGTEGAEVVACELQGPVRIGRGARLHRTLVRGPAVIGPGATLSHAYVGPYTSIGRDVEIEAAELEHSIVLPEAEIRYLDARLESSVIGRGARIVRELKVPRAMQLLVANGAEVTLA
jgi:glucose-1-phosphate thymidylyltransferase